MESESRLRAKAILRHCSPECNLQDKVELFTKEWERVKDNVRSDRSCISHIVNPLQLINDAIYGPVELTPLMYNIINTSEFHRLKDIKQLGAAHYVYPGANHTRFDHSIGVCHLAGEFARHLKRQLQTDKESGFGRDDPDWEFNHKEVLCVQLAGLCHDLGHGPYSHMFEENILQQLEDELKMKHDELSVRIFRHMLVENPKVLVEFVKAELGKREVEMIEWMIQPERVPEAMKKRAFLFEIVYNKMNGVDVNKWDYYARDCHYLGVTSDFQWRRCMHLGRIVKCTLEGKEEPELHIAFRDKQLDDIYGMYRTGVILHQRAHQHKTIKAVERMISDAFREIHRSLKLIHGREGTAVTIRGAIEEAKKGNLEPYLALTDSIIGTIKCADIKSVESNLDKNALKGAKDLLRRVEVRDLYHMAGKLRIPKMYSVLKTNNHLHEKDAVWKAAMDTEQRQPSSEAIYRLLDDRTKKEIDERDIWVTVTQFKFPPDLFEGLDEGNPAEKVLFYKKRELDKETELLSSEEIKTMSSLLVVPQAFVECELRVYDMRPTEKRKKEHQKALEKALQDWKKKAHDIAAQQQGR